MNQVHVKICGLTDAATMDAALDAGADMVGLVSFPKSPRHMPASDMAKLAERARGGVEVTILTVDATDALLDALVGEVEPDWLQLQGQESDERVAAIRARYKKPVIRAVGIRSADDVARAKSALKLADRVLLDAKPPKDASRPGGLGVAFDWRLLDALDHKHGFMLAGGLNPANVAEAIRETGMGWVDVSSGVESAPGTKDPEKIRAFIKAAKNAHTVEPIV